MSDILGPVDDGNDDKAYNTYRIYRKAAANASEARTSAQDGNKIFSQKNTADDALNTGLDRWEVKLFDVVNTYDSGAVHSSASGDAGTLGSALRTPWSTPRTAAPRRSSMLTSPRPRPCSCSTRP